MTRAAKMSFSTCDSNFDKRLNGEQAQQTSTDEDQRQMVFAAKSLFFPAQGDSACTLRDLASANHANGRVQEGSLAVEIDEELNKITVLQANGTMNGVREADMQYDQKSAEPGPMEVIPISLKFVDVVYSARVHERQLIPWNRSFCGRTEEQKQILHGITGCVLPGELVALMGPSGSGKTTLLNLLSGRKAVSKGSITYNDAPYCTALKRRMGFVMQDDILHPHLTVSETLRYAALLRLPRQFSEADKLCRAWEVISLLGLESCKDTIIGEPLSHGISGGERKRVSVGCEILTNPSILFLDEPTSGLDATIALRIVHLLRELSKAGKSVVTTIHQPSSRLFYTFDKLILLSEGHVVYLGEPRAAMDYFSSIRILPLIAMNPADFLLDLANGNLDDMSFSPERKHNFVDTEVNLSVRSQREVTEYIIWAYETVLLPRERSKLLKLSMSSELKASIRKKRKWGTSWWLQFRYLCTRTFKAQRHEVLSGLSIVQVIACSLLVGSLWLHSSASTNEQLVDQVGLLFFMSSFWTFFPFFQTIFTLPLEKAILAKERASDMYRLSAYLIARTVSVVALNLFLPLTFIFVVYFMTNLRHSIVAFALTCSTIFITTIASQSLAMAIGAAMMDVKKASVLGAVVSLAFMLSGGFYVKSLPKFVAWVRYFSISFYSFKLLVKAQYGENQIYSCGQVSGCESIASSPALRDIPLGSGAADAMIMIGFIALYQVLAYVFLRRLKIGL